jgi:hypothetical protein
MPTVGLLISIMTMLKTVAYDSTIIIGRMGLQPIKVYTSTAQKISLRGALSLPGFFGVAFKYQSPFLRVIYVSELQP